MSYYSLLTHVPVPFLSPPANVVCENVRAQIAGMSKLLAGGEKRGWRENDLRAIMSMMGPSDLSDLEDEVKVIQQNVRAWILRCNYKSLRKAARTLQVIDCLDGFYFSCTIVLS